MTRHYHAVVTRYNMATYRTSCEAFKFNIDRRVHVVDCMNNDQPKNRTGIPFDALGMY